MVLELASFIQLLQQAGLQAAVDVTWRFRPAGPVRACDRAVVPHRTNIIK